MGLALLSAVVLLLGWEAGKWVGTPARPDRASRHSGSMIPDQAITKMGHWR